MSLGTHGLTTAAITCCKTMLIQKAIAMLILPLQGFVVLGKENKVCRLVKSLYGLKQAPKQCHEKYEKTFLLGGYKVNDDSNKCLYTKFDDNLCGVIVCLYVDEMIILGTNIDVVNETKQFLSSKLDMKDLGEADLILGIKLTKLKKGYRMSQEHFVEKI
jgi:hypothetical protein